jgi:hypothetical protein
MTILYRKNDHNDRALNLTLANFGQAYRPRGMPNIGSFSTIS